MLINPNALVLIIAVVFIWLGGYLILRPQQYKDELGASACAASRCNAVYRVRSPYFLRYEAFFLKCVFLSQLFEEAYFKARCKRFFVFKS